MFVRKKKKSSGSLSGPRSGYSTTLMVFFFAHLLILQYPDHHQNLISSSFYYSGPIHKISPQFIHNFLSNVVHRQTDKLTNANKNITSFAKEVIIDIYVAVHLSSCSLQMGLSFCTCINIWCRCYSSSQYIWY